MAINTALLVSAAMLQDYFVDNVTGQAMANGVITLYQDNSRTTLKNWYEQTGVPGNYTYVPLSNPLTLSAVGTIQDNNGNDVIPFFYPYDETNNTTVQTYYITVVDSNGQNQFIRQNFPFVANSNPSPTTAVATNKNYITNNVFWRNVGSLNVSAMQNAVIAPSQHDGFTSPDIRFVKNTADATETLTFVQFVPPSNGTPFIDQVLPNDVTPEFYLNLNCSGAGTETLKYIQFPVSLHIKSLSGYATATAVIQAMNVAGNANNQIAVYLYQYLGSGVSSPTPVASSTITLTDGWAKYPVNIPIPSAANVTTGGGGDDGWFLWIGYPAGVTCNINIAKPAFYLSNTVPTNDFDNYDQVNAIISSPRTGDTKTSLSNLVPLGWVPLNDGNIGNASSSATTRANIDTWPLYSLLWTNTNNTFAPVSTGRGANAIADFNSNKTIGLTKVLGRVIQGLPTNSNFTYVNGTGIFTVGSNAFFYIGSPVFLTNSGGAIPSGFALGTIYYAMPVAGSTTTLQVASSYANAIAGTALVPASDNGSGINTLNFAMSGTFGEAEHTQLLSELVSHTHTAALYSLGAGSNAKFSNFDTGGAQSNTGTTDATGGGSPFNIVQPSIYMNVFMKL